MSKQGVKPGEWYGEAKAYARAAMEASNLSGCAFQVLVCLRLHTIAYQTEIAVTMDRGKRRFLTPTDVGEKTILSRQDVRKAMAEIEEAGYGKREEINAGGGLKKGNVALHCWTLPRLSQTRKKGQRPTYGLSDDVVGFVRRFRIPFTDDFVATREYKAALEAAAKSYKEAEIEGLRKLKEVFFVAAGAPPLIRKERKYLKEETERGAELFPGSSLVETDSLSVGRSSGKTERPKRDRLEEHPYKHKIREWLESKVSIPGFPLEDSQLDAIAATIQTDAHFEQFQKAALRQNEPRGWKVFATIARQCQKLHGQYEKSMSAGGGQQAEDPLVTRMKVDAERRRTWPTS
jgi:hypothetical protein